MSQLRNPMDITARISIFPSELGYQWPGISTKSNQGRRQSHPSSNPPKLLDPPRVPGKPFILPNHSRAEIRPLSTSICAPALKVTGYVISTGFGGIVAEGLHP
ncbi:hypothetical protein AVEN_83536-1 [Araneus ventricosus]|uniref:Uncharacterized protein n=1 Tax=Araneus ventricosus TaxID=182803 RepID=A0A4Y2H2S5_ARAVE|nr:hypothetical protein AVEN_83536-1 [Araneus ventricosus]